MELIIKLLSWKIFKIFAQIIGLKNIEELCGGQDYPRLRMGIGDNFPKGRQADYVLGRFTQEELATLPTIMDKAISMALGFCTIGIEQTMTQFND